MPEEGIISYLLRRAFMESKCGRPAAGYNGFIREESEVCEMKRVVSILLSALVWAHGGNVENCTANMQITAREGRRNLCDVQSLGATLPPTPWPRGSPIYRLQADGRGGGVCSDARGHRRYSAGYLNRRRPAAVPAEKCSAKRRERPGAGSDLLTLLVHAVAAEFCI